MNKNTRTALVTGANSGLGFEAAAQLAEDGWERIILACRSTDKAEAARAQLVERTGKDPFASLAIDTSEVASALAAANELARRGERIDLLLLNAGGSRKDPQPSSASVEVTYASTLVGHHVLTMRALADGLLTPSARIVIAGSEGARGNFPGTSVHDVDRIASEQFGGDRAAAIEAIVHLRLPAQQQRFDNMSEYCTAKLFVAWWAAALAPQLPRNMTVNAVSPGSVPSTNFGRDLPPLMRYLMFPVMKVIGPFIGMAGSIDVGARRYLDAAEFDDDTTGQFFATAGRTKLVGPLAVQTWPEHFSDRQSQAAAFEALTRITGFGFPESVGSRAS
ncbi:MAG: NAD(P)-dependent dehydrogenase (short-subunit alcohol dehydrogenase family) [Myxococcota bacterium]|jgi:NAD(P)-dependent dehydrogenase (short-subunit alcohol dehydrogenase family)